MEIKQVKRLSDLPIGNNDSVKGVSAPFAGYINNTIFVAGGCNFPTAPASKGGVKEYYKAIYRYDINNDVWKIIGELPVGLAYGASIVYENEWICIGGNNNEGSSSSVLSITYNDQINVDTLPSLPENMDNFAATLNGQYIYVAGGNINAKPQNKLFVLDLKERKEWVELAQFPGANRVQPTLLNGDKSTILLLGGFQIGDMHNAPVLSHEVLAYDTKSNSWSLETQLPYSIHDDKPVALVGGFGVNITDSLIVIGGGVNRMRFINALDAPRLVELATKNNELEKADSISNERKLYMTHPIDWYRFNKDLYQYNVVTKQWKHIGSDSSLARAGAAALTDGKELYILDGELKPGVRTDEVNKITLY
ncbi:MAG: cyclically-permuted mutarotase family protein [Bacteroidales bacterium]